MNRLRQAATEKRQFDFKITTGDRASYKDTIVANFVATTCDRKTTARRCPTTGRDPRRHELAPPGGRRHACRTYRSLKSAGRPGPK